jgi:L-ascorbate metabolism protein UlaG (beta-lactamase superfamily)
MKLKWYGHASFLVTADDGATIITDPFTPETSGYPAVEDAPDVVVISSDNDLFHCRADLIPGHPVVINALEVARSGKPRTEHGITFSAIQAMEALNHRYHDPDQNGMYRFSVDGVSIGHMGDMGNPLDRAQLDFFKGVDVFLALAGGHPTIELRDLKRAIDVIRPLLVVPMHFQTLTYKPRNIYWIDKFLDLFQPSDVDFATHYEVSIMRDSLPKQTRVLLLDYVHQRPAFVQYAVR